MSPHIDQAAQVLIRAKSYELEVYNDFVDRFDGIPMPGSARNRNLRAAAMAELETGEFSLLVPRGEWREQGRVAMDVPSRHMTLVLRALSSQRLQLPMNTSADYTTITDTIEHLLMFDFASTELSLSIVEAMKVQHNNKNKYLLRGYPEPLGEWSLLTGEHRDSQGPAVARLIERSAGVTTFEQNEEVDWLDFDDDENQAGFSE